MAKFIICNRTAGLTSKHAKVGSRAIMDSVADTISHFSDVGSDNAPKDPEKRRLINFECEQADFDAKKAEWGSEVIAEPEMLRQTAIAYPQAMDIMGLQANSATLGNALGNQQPFEVTVRCGKTPVANATVTATFLPLSPADQAIPMGQLTNAKGVVSFAYNPAKYRPGVLLVVPKEGSYSCLEQNLTHGMTIDLLALPKSGPLGWWHQILGIDKYVESRGKGIRIGVADTGVGPHPYLSHVTNVGAFLGGIHIADGGADIEEHGTHVCGILGARPSAGSNDFGGIAPGADVFCARIFNSKDPANPTSKPTTTNGDLASAIDNLYSHQKVDLINLSLGGESPSQIEQDAIQAALESGTLTIAAAGNSYGKPVMFPAAYPTVVALSAIGIPSAAPASTLDGMSKPDPSKNPYAFGMNGNVYLASFSNIGFSIKCTGPGVGIISTVPSVDGQCYYASMSGTSMASPAVCASLAALLSEDEIYKKLPRNSTRATRAYEVLMLNLRRLDSMPTNYVGGGLPTAVKFLA